MTIEVRPLGVKCNLRCTYCYQNPQRDAGAVAHSYDLDTLKAQIEATGQSFALFGGEPLLVPIADLEQLWAWGYERFGTNTVQTNGTLVTDEHIRLFKKYAVSVGVSVDGSGELNDLRWAGSLEKTRRATERSQEAIRRLVEERIGVTVAITIHRINASEGKLPLLHDWIRQLDRWGVQRLNLHILEVDDEDVRKHATMTPEENLAAYLSLVELEATLQNARFIPFEHMRNLQKGQDRATNCVWHPCDTYNTSAVYGIEGNGQLSNCGRTNKAGIDYLKADTKGFERQLALYHTPQEYLGCKGCRFFAMCKGQCPGTSLSGDWRNRSEHCQVWKGLFGHFEEELQAERITPLSLRPDLAAIEASLLGAWRAGRSATLAGVLEELDANPPAAGDIGAAVPAPRSAVEDPGTQPIEAAVLARLEQFHGARLGDLAVRDIGTGDYFTFVELSDGSQGAAINLVNVHGPHNRAYDDVQYDRLLRQGLAADPLLRRSFLERARLDELGQSVKMAVMNALSSPLVSPGHLRAQGLTVGEGWLELEPLLKPGDTVAMIGCMGNYSCWQVGGSSKPARVYFSDFEYVEPFCGFVEQFIASTFTGPAPVHVSDGSRNREICQAADVVILAAATFVTNTLDEILRWSQGAREIVVVGRSWVMDPLPLFDRGVTVLTLQRIVKPGIVAYARDKVARGDRGFTDELGRCFQMRWVRSGPRLPQQPPAARRRPQRQGRRAEGGLPPVEQAVLARLEEALGERLDQLSVADLTTAGYFTVVRLSDGSQGAAINLHNVHGPHRREAPDGYDRQLLAAARTDPLLQDAILRRPGLDERGQSVKVALLNALSSRLLTAPGLARQGLTLAEDLLEVERLLRPGDTVAMIGCMGNYSCWHVGRRTGDLERVYFSDFEYVDPYRGFVERFVQDTFHHPDKVVLSDGSDNEAICRAADVVLITSGTVCTNTLDALLDWSQGAREVVVLGRTWASDPVPLFERGVTALTMQRIVHPDLVSVIRDKAARGDRGFDDELVACFELYHVTPARSATSPIIVETLDHLETAGQLAGRKLRSLCLGHYFTVAELSDGSVGRR